MSLEQEVVPSSNGNGAGVAMDGGQRILVADLHRPPIDVTAAQAAVRDLLVALGRDPDEPGIAETPRRLAQAYAQLLQPTPFELTTFENETAYDELIIVRSIPFHSLCEHHMLPFHGHAHIAYLPRDRVLGLSKLARTLELFARDLQLQERLTCQVADFIDGALEPRGVGVVIEAEHLCMSLRGVQKEGSKTVTSALRGLLRDDERTRAEFLALVRDA
ncbi:MAG TPA: GTP cyclohydrolase I FolE [Conexibacter sp.]|jgi:GTP cyclohydrolase I